jgi:hypothetical protein
MGNKYYYLIVDGGCYISQSGPYDTYEDRDKAAKAVRGTSFYSSRCPLVVSFWADIENGELKVGEFVDGFEDE